MGVPASKFIDDHDDKLDEIKRSLLDYVTDLQKRLTNPEMHVDPTPPDTSETYMRNNLTKDGYPILPSISGIRALNKINLTRILWEFLTAHYRKF